MAEGEVAQPAPRRAAMSQAARSLRTRQRILKAAHGIFVRQGFSGAKMERIAEAAKTNKRLVYHHFGTKADLFRTVLEDAYGAMRRAERQLNLGALPPAEAMTTLVRFTWEYYNAHEDFISLVATENLCKAVHIRASDKIPDLSSSLRQMVSDVVRRGAREGVFRRDVDPVQLWISISAMCWFFVANKHTIAVTFGAEFLQREALEDRLAHVLSVVHAFLAPTP